MPEDEFYGLMQIADVFDLVWLEESFAQQIKEKLSKHPLLDEKDLSKLKGKPLAEIEKHIEDEGIPLKAGWKSGRVCKKGSRNG